MGTSFLSQIQMKQIYPFRTGDRLDEYIFSVVNTSNGRFAVDRELEYIELVS